MKLLSSAAMFLGNVLIVLDLKSPRCLAASFVSSVMSQASCIMTIDKVSGTTPTLCSQRVGYYPDLAPLSFLFSFSFFFFHFLDASCR